ncbi:MAG: type IX secretion system sortase PorU [Bacteroides sp.]|nr:type IX secretion system sortase PorU [Bacteroides sp.]MCM1413957.1 type IX secretion system sortase PorU [Bacteroides sp.]MCM1471826.1 type IX secretion system sortase PorU [Bacteroides sp.]
MTRFYSNLTNIFLALTAFLIGTATSNAFPTDIYAKSSQLSSGKWVKISVSETGVHFIPAATLRSWGFSDISKVKIHGYGGRQIPDQLTQANYKDDLPELSTIRNASGIYFYGVATETWAVSARQYAQTINPYSTNGYYFVSQSDEAPSAVETQSSTIVPEDYATTFTSLIYHEVDKYSLSSSGTMFFGEDFRSNRSQTFNLKLHDLVEDQNAWIRIAFVTNTTSASTVAYDLGNSVNGTISMNSADDNFGVRKLTSRTFKPAGENLDVKLTFQPSGMVTAAHLDALTVNYPRYLRLYNGRLEFSLSKTSAALSGSTAKTHVWDVTDSETPIEMGLTLNGDQATWVNPYYGTRRYYAWNEDASLPTPKLVSSVANQDIHATTMLPDMIIITVKDFAGEAERIANLHRNAPDNFNVLVVNQEEVFNEFSSGTRDPGAFRRMLKMFYDRGREAGRIPRYCLLLGRAFYDVRGVTTESKSYTDPMLPTWQSSESLAESSTYCSDDVMVMLEDNSGNSLLYDRLSMSIGRIPARTLSQAKAYVDKLYAYNENKQLSPWKQSIILEADNGNSGMFMAGDGKSALTTGLEGLYNGMMADEDASQFLFTKVYYDAFPIQNGYCAKADERFTRSLNEGSMLWIYNGHGALETLGGEGLHSKTKINSMYNKHWPVLFAMTCSFGQWDGLPTSGVETVSFNPDGGAIATLSATRKAPIPGNDDVVMALGRSLMRRDAEGSYLRLGDMIYNAKNTLITTKQPGGALTKLRMALLGDPAMRMLIPDATITLDEINGEEVTADNQTTIMARQRVKMSGSLRDVSGNVIDDFNGTLALTLFDAETTTTSAGLAVDETGGRAVNFDEAGSKLFTGRSKVEGGRFEIEFAMPAEIADNFRPATVGMYAYTVDGREAAGVNRDIFVYGFDDMAESDSLPPVIDYAYLNHPSFTNGGTTNEQPTFMAGVSDDIGINLSMAGIGHQMMLKVDDSQTFNDVSLYYTPASDGSASGTIAYPMSELEDGAHTLTFRVWDTSGNSTTHAINFFVEHGAAPTLLDIFTDVNPATTHANFYLSHNRPDAMATVTLDIYSISGRRIWTTTSSGRSDLFLSAPIQWDLRDMGGQRVIRGIYIYRATLTIDGYTLTSPARRIAVTGN